MHVPIAWARRRLLLVVLGPLNHVVDTKTVDALLLLAVRLACRLVGVVAGRLATLELGAGLGGLVFDLFVGLRLGDGVIEELQVVLGDDRGGWESVSRLAMFVFLKGGGGAHMRASFFLHRSLYCTFLRGFRSSLAMLWPCSARYWMNISWKITVSGSF